MFLTVAENNQKNLDLGLCDDWWRN